MPAMWLKKGAGPAVLAIVLMVGVRTAFADVPDDKSERIRQYLHDHLEITQPSSSSYELRQGTGTTLIRVDDQFLAQAASDSELIERVTSAERSRALWQLAWSPAFPLGAYVFFDNFLGNPRPSGLANSAPSPVVSFYPAGDWRSYAIATAGLAIAAYGVANLGSWVAERFHWSIPNLLPNETAKKAVDKANKALMDDLILTAEDIANASQSLAATTATGSMGIPTLTGEEGSAAFYLARAADTLRSQRGPGYRLFLVYTKDLADKSGKLQRGSWHFCFYHPEKLEALDVAVPVFGAAPSVGGPPPDAFKSYWTSTNLLDRWTVDSPRALQAFENELQRRGKVWLPEDSTLLLYPFYYSYNNPIWILDLSAANQSVPPLPVGVDASSDIAVDLRPIIPNLLPGSAGSNPTGTVPGHP